VYWELGLLWGMVIPFFIVAIFHQVKVYGSDFVSIVAEKKATIPPKSYRTPCSY